MLNTIPPRRSPRRARRASRDEPHAPVAVDPVLTNGKTMRLDRVLNRAMPWMRALQETLAKDRAGIGEIVRRACETDEGTETLGDMLDKWQSLAGAFDELAGMLRLGHDRVALVMCELTEEAE
jgi:hypothetical protein